MSGVQRAVEAAAIRAAAIGAAVVLVAALAACTPTRPCTEIGWVNEIEVAIAGATTDGVAAVELCTDHGCVEPRRVAAARVGTWVFDVGVETPAAVRVEVTDAAGAVRSSGAIPLEWTGTDEPNGPGCSNQSVTGPISLRVADLLPPG